jgi:hypothetical protein
MTDPKSDFPEAKGSNPGGTVVTLPRDSKGFLNIATVRLNSGAQTNQKPELSK